MVLGIVVVVVVGVDICQLIDVVGVILRNISGGGDRC